MTLDPPLFYVSWATLRAQLHARFGTKHWWWRFTRAWYDSSAKTVYVWRGLRYMPHERLLAHEYGHHLGLGHPEKGSADWYLDVMGLGLRIRDRHGMMRRSRAWRRATAQARRF